MHTRYGAECMYALQLKISSLVQQHRGQVNVTFYGRLCWEAVFQIRGGVCT